MLHANVAVTTGASAPLCSSTSLTACPTGSVTRCPIGAPLGLYRNTLGKLQVIYTIGGADWADGTSGKLLVKLDLGASSPVATVLKTFATTEKVYAAPLVVGNEVYVATSFGDIESMGAWDNSGGNGNAFSDYSKQALQGGSKTGNGT